MDLDDYYNNNHCLLSRHEYLYLAKLIKNNAPCNLLVFGVGHDSDLWVKLNNNGKTIFLEHDDTWIDIISKKINRSLILNVKYTTRRRQWRWLLFASIFGLTKKLRLTLPEKIDLTDWDIIFVDAPQGDSPISPGRMQSIYTASKLSYSHILVHDCDRVVEKKACDIFIGNIFHEIGRLRHYQK